MGDGRQRRERHSYGCQSALSSLSTPSRRVSWASPRLAFVFPLGNLPRYVFGRSSVDAYPDYDDAAARQAVAVAGCVHIETAVRQVIDVCR